MPSKASSRKKKGNAMSQKQKSLVGGVSILGLAGLICKVVGVLYRIPLAAYIGGEGLGIYQKVFPAYNLLLTISSAGIPIRSKMRNAILAPLRAWSARLMTLPISYI